VRIAILLSVLLGSAIAVADEPPPPKWKKKPPDPMLGRIDGDLSLGAALGATFAPRSPRLTLDVRARYLSTAGAFVTYEDATSFSLSSAPSRVVSFGVEMRPLFLPRVFTGRDFGGNRLDLFVDSFAFELGVAFLERPGSAMTTTPAAKLGIGMEFPLFSKASGLFISAHGGALVSGQALSSAPVKDANDRSLYGFVGIAWHQVFASGLIDAGDTAPE